MQILERITTPTRSFTIWDGEGFVGQGVKTRTWEDRVKELESIGASREDAEEVINAQDVVNRGTQYETFAFAMQWHRGQRLQDAINKMHKNIVRKENQLCKLS